MALGRQGERQADLMVGWAGLPRSPGHAFYEDVDDVTLTYYDSEESFRAMKLPEEGDDLGFRQLATAETAKVMLEHGLRLTAQILNAKEYFEWLGARENTYQAQHDYPGGRHVSGDEAKALLGIE
jgi:hypothetical protein